MAAKKVIKSDEARLESLRIVAECFKLMVNLAEKSAGVTIRGNVTGASGQCAVVVQDGTLEIRGSVMSKG